MSKSKKAVKNRLAKLVEYQQKVCDLLYKLSDDAYDLSISIGVGARRNKATTLINEYLKDAVMDRHYYESLQVNILEEIEEGGEQ